MKKRLLSLLLALALLVSAIPAASAANQTAIESANSLYTLGLFKGVGTNSDGTPIYALDRSATRQEAITMLVRLLGKESEAQNGTWPFPFTDVDSWAAPYVGYAYKMGLTKGLSATLFGSQQRVTCDQYLTLVLRALGYSDSGLTADFTWDSPIGLTDSIGLTSGEYSDNGAFVRSDIAIISFRSLSQKIKNSSTSLAKSLVNAGVLTRESVEKVNLSAALDDSGTTPPANTTLTAEQVYQKCAPAVFYIEVYDANGKATASGSGFFISASGTAVTNYHVIEGAHSAKITMEESHKVYQVSGIYDYNILSDLALLKIDGGGFPYLTMGDSSKVSGGATVYAIGNPLGFSGSISEGIVSNANRIYNNLSYFQTTAAISNGSSGGALINSSGKVVGVTSGTFVGGQNINLAVPINNIKSLSQSNLKTFQDIIDDAARGNYTEFPDVPDFGIINNLQPVQKSISPSASGGYVGLYLYARNAVTEELITAYTDALIASGYTYNGNFRSTDGYNINYYYKQKINRYVYIGTVKVNNILYYGVQISSSLN